jgi:DNA-binding NarL/FixJ family response regulator
VITASAAHRPVLPRTIADPLSELAYQLLVTYVLRLRLVSRYGQDVSVETRAPRTKEPLASLLTATELRVARMIAAGATNREIGTWLSISEKTVESHVTHIYKKTGARSRGVIGCRVGREYGFAGVSTAR